MRVNNAFTADFLRELSDLCMREDKLEKLYSNLSEYDKDCINDACRKLFVDASSGDGGSIALSYCDYPKKVSRSNVELWFQIQGFAITHSMLDENVITIEA